MTPGTKILLSSCGLWVIYYGIERLKRTGPAGKYVYHTMLVPVLFTSAFLIFSLLNMLADSLLAKLGSH